jgi:FdhE protein
VNRAADAVAARLTARAGRARTLAARHPACADVLTCYAALAAWQHDALTRATAVLRPAAASFAAALEPAAVAALVPSLRETVATAAPPALAAALAALPDAEAFWAEQCLAVWRAPTGDATTGDEVALFVAEAALQPFAEVVAAARAPLSAASPDTAVRCPICGGLAVAGLLREEGHGAGRALVCGLCGFAWRVPRAVCPQCGEADVARLAVYRDDTWPAVRLDACETCRTYVKTVDRTADGHADPIVDDLASLPLDLWAFAQDYRRMRPALLRV